jgi:CheY-like chemotaxis protein
LTIRFLALRRLPGDIPWQHQVDSVSQSGIARREVSLTFLIVEDNSEMRRLIKQAVTRKSDIVYECSDGVEALASYARHKPDWVLMDIKMPRLDGVTATRQITEAFPQAKILVVSQYNDPEMRESAHDAGAFGYVLKDDLLAIRRIIGRG